MDKKTDVIICYCKGYSDNRYVVRKTQLIQEHTLMVSLSVIGVSLGQVRILMVGRKESGRGSVAVPTHLGD